MNNLLFINWSPSIGLDLGFINLRYYSLMLILAFFVGYRILEKIYKKENKPLKDLDTFLTFIAIGLLLGLRFGHVFFYDWSYYKNHLLEILLPFQFEPKFKFIGFAGLASHGGFIGGITAVYLYCRKLKYNFFWVLDRAVISVAFGGAFVRIGNFINSEIIGKQTLKPWGVVFKNLNENIARHPTQIYESLCYILIFFILLKLYQKGKGELKGFLSGSFMICIFGVRFFMEFLKENQVSFEDSMSFNMGQLLSIPIILIGVYLILTSKKR